jgi:putative membrane protein
MATITHWIVSALVIIVTAFLVPGASVGVVSALLTAIVLGFLNTFIKPLIVVLTLPINILTLGLFTFVINAVLIMIASAIVPGFKVGGFGSALIFSIVLALVNIIFVSLTGGF